MIKINKLTREFGSFRAVDDLSFSVVPGEVLGFLGPNGAGKTTTMRMITGFLKPSSGSISVFGHDTVADSRAASECLGYLPEGAPAYGEMTPNGFLNFIGQVRGLRGSSLQGRIDKVVEDLQLHNVLRQPIDTLSKGFKRRVGLAQAILHEPRALVLDEPTDGLDPNQKQQVRELISEIARDRIIIVSTHILEEVSAVCTRAMIIADGKLVADGTPTELEARSRYHGALTVCLGGSEATHTSLGQQPWVGSLEAIAGSTGRYTIFPTVSGQQALEALGQWATGNDVAVEELTLERGRLDEVFRTLTTDTAAQEGARHAG